MKNYLKKYINEIHQINDDILDEFLNHWEESGGKKREIITQIDKTEKHLYFVIEGVQKAYYLVDGKAYTLLFRILFLLHALPSPF